MDNEEDDGDGGGIPEWVVTFGDMMSLLLTFFIMLVSLSEIKEEEKYQALVESMRQKFGYAESRESVMPGRARPRNSHLSTLATQGRAQKLDVMKGGNKVKSPTGDHSLVRVIRMGTRSQVGTVLQFDELSAELSDAHRDDLRSHALEIGGKPQKIEIRGHTSLRPASEAGFSDNWQLAYQRSRAVMRYLVDDLKIRPERIRLSVAGPYEPLHISVSAEDLDRLAENPRVEIFLLDEVVSDFYGTEGERGKRTIRLTPDGAPQ